MLSYFLSNKRANLSVIPVTFISVRCTSDCIPGYTFYKDYAALLPDIIEIGAEHRNLYRLLVSDERKVQSTEINILK